MPTSRPGKSSKIDRSGFSLLEVFIVLLVMSLAAVLVAPSFTRGFKGLELETSGRDLVTIMKLARSQAIAKQQVFRVI
jgi:prepilin-type N-terminal cleavage/methylation domain-containing protein